MLESNDNSAPADNLAPPPDLTPPSADPAPAPAPSPSIDYQQLAAANAQALAPVFQQFAPKPAPAPWESDNYFEIPAGLDGPAAAKWVRDRVSAVAEAKAEAKAKAEADALRREFSAALNGQAQYMAARFSADPKFAAIQSHFDKYARAGYSAQDARYLAERDAGMHSAQTNATPGAATTRTVGAPPPHLTTPTGRAGANAPANGFDPVKFKTDENYRFVRFKQHAANVGINLDD